MGPHLKSVGDRKVGSVAGAWGQGRQGQQRRRHQMARVHGAQRSWGFNSERDGATGGLEQGDVA